MYPVEAEGSPQSKGKVFLRFKLLRSLLHVLTNNAKVTYYEGMSKKHDL